MRRTDIKISYLKGSGPGGQHRNKRFTGVRIEHLPSGTVAMATERRVRHVNIENALERLEKKVKALAYIAPKRIPTRVSKGAQARRMKSKEKRSVTKKLRQRSRADWD